MFAHEQRMLPRKVHVQFQLEGLLHETQALKRSLHLVKPIERLRCVRIVPPGGCWGIQPSAVNPTDVVRSVLHPSTLDTVDRLRGMEPPMPNPALGVGRLSRHPRLPRREGNGGHHTFKPRAHGWRSGVGQVRGGFQWIGSLEHRRASHEHVGTCVHQGTGVAHAHTAVDFNQHV